MPRPRLLTFLTCAVLAAAAASAQASTITVTTSTDDVTAGDHLCSLRKAIAAVDSPGTASGDCAAAAYGANTIVLAPGTYVLNPLNAPGQLQVSSTVTSLTIAGSGTAATTISANGGSRVLTIAGGASVLIDNLTITRGQAPAGANGSGNGGAGGTGAGGGAILNAGNLALADVAITQSHAGGGGSGAGGGSAHAGGAGGAGGPGGAVDNTGTLQASGVTFLADAAGNGGNGGAAGAGGTTGAAGGAGGTGGFGGAVANSSSGSVAVAASTFQADTAGLAGTGGPGGKGSATGGGGGAGARGGYGGAIEDNGGALSITNSTFASDSAGTGGAGGAGAVGASKGGAGGSGGLGGSGGALSAAPSATIALTSATLAGNSAGTGGPGGAGGTGKSGGATGSGGAANSGGGIDDTGSRLTVTDTLLASNPRGNCAAPALVNGGHNLSFGDSSCPAAFLNGNPQLGPLQDNGGPTETIGLGPGSAAVGQNPTGTGCPSTDQRGVARPAGGACDIGAYQATAPLASTGSLTALAATRATVSGTVTPYAGGSAVVVQYGTTAAYGSTTAAVDAGGVSSTHVAITLAGLRPRTVYHYRFVISTADGTGYGADRSFATDVPVLSSLAITPSRFVRGRRATISYRDSDRSLTTFTLIRCVQRISRHSSRCRRYATVLTFTHRDGAGRNRFAFTARLHGRALPSGAYRLEAVPQAGIARGGRFSVRFILT